LVLAKPQAFETTSRIKLCRKQICTCSRNLCYPRNTTTTVGREWVNATWHQVQSWNQTANTAPCAKNGLWFYVFSDSNAVTRALLTTLYPLNL